MLKKALKKRSERVPVYEYVLMFKIIILHRLYSISNDRTGYQINDRLLFMRFLGLKDKVPNEKTIWLFKKCLIEGKVSEKLFEKFCKEPI